MKSKFPVVILARGGSKGLPKKNILDFCGKPLIAWTIDFALNSKSVLGVWVSTDSDEIAKISTFYGAKVISRPSNLAGDSSSSEDGWFHAVKELELQGIESEIFIALQPTSPLRLADDLDKAVFQFFEYNLDCLFSGSILEDLTLWKISKGELSAVNHDPKLRKTRQESSIPVVENGSIYIMKKEVLKNGGNRFSGKIGFSPNLAWQIMEIDSLETFKVCEVLMKSFVIKYPSN